MKNSFNVKRFLRQNDVRWSGFDGYQGSELNPGLSVEREWSLANGGTQVKVPKPYLLTVTNSTGSNLTAVLFGLNKYLQTSNFGSTAGVTVTPSSTNLTYLEVLMQSGQQPFETSLIRVSSTNASQVTQTLDVTFKDATGQVLSDPVYADPYVSAYQYQNTRADIPYSLKIDGNTFITVTILANTTVNFTFFPAEKVNVAKGLMGQNPRQIYGAPPVNLGGMPLPGRV